MTFDEARQAACFASTGPDVTAVLREVLDRLRTANSAIAVDSAAQILNCLLVSEPKCLGH